MPVRVVVVGVIDIDTGIRAGVGAILAGGTRPLTLSMALGPALLLRALGASMIGGLRSIWGSFAGGVGIGIVEALIIWNYPVGGVLEVVLAALIMVSMLVRPGLGRKDEIGDIAGAVEQFKVKAAEKARLEADEVLRRQKAEADAQARAAEERAKAAEETAKALGVTIPPTLLARADEVIE